MTCTAAEFRGLVDVRRFRRARWLLILGPPIATVVMVVTLGSSANVGIRAARDCVLLIALGTAMFALLGYPVCPRCGENFEGKRWGRWKNNIAYNPLTRRCLSCGLRLDAGVVAAPGPTRRHIPAIIFSPAADDDDKPVVGEVEAIVPAPRKPPA